MSRKSTDVQWKSARYVTRLHAGTGKNESSWRYRVIYKDGYTISTGGATAEEAEARCRAKMAE